TPVCRRVWIRFWPREPDETGYPNQHRPSLRPCSGQVGSPVEHWRRACRAFLTLSRLRERVAATSAFTRFGGGVRGAAECTRRPFICDALTLNRSQEEPWSVARVAEDRRVAMLCDRKRRVQQRTKILISGRLALIQ